MDQRITPYTVRHHEAGPDGTLRLAPLFDFFQDSAAENAEEIGFGMAALEQLGCLWVLSRIRLGITRLPAIGEKITLETYPNGTEKLFARRQFALRDEAGNPLVCASSLWLAVDRKRQRPVRPETLIPVSLQRNLERPTFFPVIDKFAELDSESPVRMEYRIGHSQIDVNGHLNNAFYAAFVSDLLGQCTGSFVQPREMQINFLHACLPGDVLCCRGQQGEAGTWRFDGTLATGQISFQAEVLL